MCAKQPKNIAKTHLFFYAFRLAPACDILYIIKYYIFLRKLLTNLTAVVYYYYDHKVGVVGDYALIRKNGAFVFFVKRHNPVKQNKCSV